MKGNVSGYVCNHGSPSGERDTASPGLWAMLQTQASDEEADDVSSRRHLYCGTPVVTSWAVAGQQVVFFHMYLQTESRWGLVPHSGNHGYIRNLRRFSVINKLIRKKFGITFHDICFDLIVKNPSEHNTEVADSLTRASILYIADGMLLFIQSRWHVIILLHFEAL